MRDVRGGESERVFERDRGREPLQPSFITVLSILCFISYITSNSRYWGVEPMRRHLSFEYLVPTYLSILTLSTF